MLSPESSPDRAANTISPVQLSPAQASFVYWLNGLAPVLTSIVTPLATYWVLRKKPDKTAIQKYNQQVNEVVRQFVSGTVGLVGYFGGGETTKGLLDGAGKLFPDSAKMDEASKQVLMIVGGTLISFLGYAFIRPKISTDLICNLLKQEDTGLKRSYQNLSTFKPMRWLQNWADNNLISKKGGPDLSKTARYSAGFLTAYLGGGALLIGLLKKVFQCPAQPASSNSREQKQLPALPGFPMAGQPVPMGVTPLPANLYFARNTQPRLYMGQSSPVGTGLYRI